MFVKLLMNKQTMFMNYIDMDYFRLTLVSYNMLYAYTTTIHAYFSHIGIISTLTPGSWVGKSITV